MKGGETVAEDRIKTADAGYRAPDFTDGMYMPREDLPNLPGEKKRKYGNIRESVEFPESARGKLRMPGIIIAVVAIICAILWIALRSAIFRTWLARDETPVSAEEPGLQPGEVGGWLGIDGRTLTPAAAEYYSSFEENDVVPGVLVQALEKNGPGERAGLAPGDVITAFGGVAVRSREELTEAESGFSAGDRAELSYYRQGETRTAEILFPEE